MTGRGLDSADVLDDLGAEPRLDDALERLFAPYRVDAAGFEREVAARVAAREAAVPTVGGAVGDGVSSPSEPAAHTAFWRRVAAFLPFDTSTGGAASGAVAAKVFGGKVLPAALLLPALVLAAVVGAFFAGLRRVRADGPGGAPRVDSPGRRVAGGPKKPWWVHIASVILIGLIVSPWPALAADAMTLALAASTLALACAVRELAGTGVTERRDVAVAVREHVMGMLSLCFLQAAQLPIPIPSSELGLVIATAALLAVLARAHVVATRRQLSLRMVAAWAVLLYVINPMGLTFRTPLVLRPKLAAMDLEPLELRGWEEAAALHRALVAVGSPAPEPRGARARVAEALAAGRAPDVHPVVWTAALDFGWFGEVEWRALAAQLERQGPLPEPGRVGAVALTEYERYRLAMTLARSDVTREWRDDLAACLERSWPTAGRHGALVAALEVVRRLEMLGRSDLVASLRERAHALLRDHWVSPSKVDTFGRAGGFTSEPAQFRTSFADQTLAAVELMARFGVPGGVDIGALRSYLRDESRAKLSLVPEAFAYLRAKGRAALLRLDRQLALPPVGLVARALGERFTLASLLLAVMGLVALRATRALGPGALP